MHRYCTYFDHRFLDRGLAMIRSLRRVEPDCRISVLCLTPACERVLSGLGEPGVTLTSLASFERDNPDLLAIKESRCLRDYYFTLSGCVVAAALEAAGPDEIVTYLDADLFFYASPVPLFESMAGASVGLIGHRFHWWAKRLEKYGRFNVGWVSFRADATGQEAAQWWRSRCIEWCYGFVDGDRFADQKYLEHMAANFPKVVEIRHPGANLGPWNICRHTIAPRADGGFTVDANVPLIFFHFSGLREVEPGVFLCSRPSYLGPFSKVVRSGLYATYVALLLKMRKEIGGIPTDPSPPLSVEVRPSLTERVTAPTVRMASRWAGHYVGEARATRRKGQPAPVT
ncbi:hypothetical protein BH11PSE3_BH11PSE3_24040 [soil metagenome]